MFVRKGQALGSVNLREFAELTAPKRRKQREPSPPPKGEPAPQPAAKEAEPKRASGESTKGD